MPKQSVASDQLTATAIATAAIEIVDRSGPEALSFRVLGDALGVSQTTVHRRCGESTHGLIDICMNHLAGQLPEVDPQAAWPEAAEAAFTALYRLLTAHPGLLVLRGSRPWLGEALLQRLTEPLLQAGVSSGLSPQGSVTAYRRLYLFTLGCAAFVDHTDPQAARQRTRTGLAALDPEQFPFLTGRMEAVLGAVTDHGVYHSGLRQLIDTVALDLYPVR